MTGTITIELADIAYGTMCMESKFKKSILLKFRNNIDIESNLMSQLLASIDIYQVKSGSNFIPETVFHKVQLIKKILVYKVFN